MDIEISIKATFIAKYEKAKKEQEKGNTIWTILSEDGLECCEQRLLKKNAIGWLCLPKKTEEIIIFKREKWKVV